MSSEAITGRERVPGFCSMCVSRCGTIAVVEDGRLVALEPDPSHPTGQAICAKGRAAPELVYHPDRLLYPLKRTRPKGDGDPGWQRISWDEALDFTASQLQRLAEKSGPQSVVFAAASPSTSAISDSLVWIERLMRAFGSPNLCASMELCGWGRYLATRYTFGSGVPGVYMPDLENASCILFWGYNPNVARLVHATATTKALKRGARLIVVDPRRAGTANKADLWLQVRPGTDGALALAIAQVMIDRGWYDHTFVRDWTNGPLLVRADNGRFLTQHDLNESGGAQTYLAWNEVEHSVVSYDAATGQYAGGTDELACFGEVQINTRQGSIVCRPAFDLVAEMCRGLPLAQAESICGVPADQIIATARMLWEARPVAYYAWSGVEQQTNATQIARAIAQLYVLTGCFDDRGGNVLFASVPANNVAGFDFLRQRPPAPALGLAERPLGPARWQFVTTDEIYRAILDQQPYGVHGLVGFGANLLLAHADAQRGRSALAQLDFYVHADLFMNPTAQMADIVLPVASCFESEALRIGFETSTEAQSFVQLRRQAVAPCGEARSDTEIVFDLACRLGYGDRFWHGDIASAYQHQLEPSGITVGLLRENRSGIRVPLSAGYRKFAEQVNGAARGFDTPTRRIELYSELLLAAGYPPLPTYAEPLLSPISQPQLAQRFPLVLTCAKHTLFCESQHRALPSLRRKALDPEVELHPLAAEERGIQAGDWVEIETPDGRVRARARLNNSLHPSVVCAQHGWWQACAEIGAQGYDPFSPEGANLNLAISSQWIDPISGSVPHRAYLCQLRRAA